MDVTVVMHNDFPAYVVLTPEDGDQALFDWCRRNEALASEMQPGHWHLHRIKVRSVCELPETGKKKED